MGASMVKHFYICFQNLICLTKSPSFMSINQLPITLRNFDFRLTLIFFFFDWHWLLINILALTQVLICSSSCCALFYVRERATTVVLFNNGIKEHANRRRERRASSASTLSAWKTHARYCINRARVTTSATDPPRF